MPSSTPSGPYFKCMILGSIMLMVFLMMIVFSMKALELSWILFVSLMCIFVFVFVPYIMFEQNTEYIEWSKNTLLELFKEKTHKFPDSSKLPTRHRMEANLIRSLRGYIAASGIIANTDELDRIDRTSARTTYSLLVYFITTFPKMRIMNFTPFNEETLLDTVKTMEFEEIEMSDFHYFMHKWKKYLSFIFPVFKRKKRA